MQARARELLDSGMSRKDAARVIRDETGSTLAEATSILPPEPAPTPAPTSPESGPAQPEREPGAFPGTPTLPSLPKPSRAVRSAVSAGGGAILGTLTYVLALAYLRDGPAGVRAWLRAKFLNRVGPAPAPVPAVPRTPAPATPGARGQSGLADTATAGSGASGAGGGTW